jgi:type VI protein secretion system component VasK
VAWFWWLLGVLVIVVWIVTVVDIVRRRHTRPGSKTAAWILLVIMLPIVGTVVYYLVNGAPGRPGRPIRTT